MSKQKTIYSLLTDMLREGYELPDTPVNIPHGDMPGDKIAIDDSHIIKAKTIFPVLLENMQAQAAEGKEKLVLCVCGGSGVGKSEIASVLAYYLESQGIGAYILSGDNYPHRIPMYNDAERLQVFREAAIRGMILDGVYQKEYIPIIQELQEKEIDAATANIGGYPWMESYIRNGRAALSEYLGTPKEIDFDEVTGIIRAFHGGAEKIWLKRMGRTETELWYEEVDFADKQVLILEWTHGNSDHIEGVDIPILLNSTPEETLAHRRARNRDGKTDSAFTTMVLEIEQGKLVDQAHKAKIIIAKSGRLLTYEEV